MGKKRTPENSKLPKNLYCTGGYYSYKHPIEKRHIGLGRNRVRAVQSANAANRLILRNTIARQKAEGLVTMLTHDEIAEAAISRSALCGVYFLVLDGRVVYVGQSTNIHKRIAHHLSEGVKEFDSFHFIECDAAILDEVEAAYIVALDPPLNRVVRQRKARDLLSGTVRTSILDNRGNGQGIDRD